MSELAQVFVERVRDEGQWFHQGERVEFFNGVAGRLQPVLEKAALGSYEVLGCQRVGAGDACCLDVRLVAVFPASAGADRRLAQPGVAPDPSRSARAVRNGACSRRSRVPYQRPSSFRTTTMTTMAPISVMMPIAPSSPAVIRVSSRGPHSEPTRIPGDGRSVGYSGVGWPRSRRTRSPAATPVATAPL
jgi:hypothetical protein